MKKKIKELLKVISLILVVSFIIPVNIATAFPKKSYTYTNETYTNKIELNSNISFDGVFDSYRWIFNSNSKEGTERVTLNLEIEVTDVLSDKIKSYLTFSLNGSQFYSMEIKKKNGEPQALTVNLPSYLLKEGSNEVKVEGYLRISSESCTDDYNTANWLVLRGKSNIELVEKAKIYGNEIMEFPYGLSESYDSNNKIIIPDKYTDGELSSALKFQTLLGGINGNGEIVKWSDRGDLSKSNVIFIGSKEEGESNLPIISNDIKDLPLDNEAYIGVNNSPFSTRSDLKLISIISNSETELESAIKFLMNKDIYGQVSSSSTFVNSNLDLDKEIKPISSIITLDELGISEMKVEGLFRKEVKIGYALPKNKKLSPGDKLELNLRYSENLDFDRSLFTVYINDTPIGSKKLEREKANNDNISIVIPKDVLNTSYLEIKLAYDLNLKGVECEKNQHEQPWGLVTGDSYIQINSRNTNEFYFNNYPAPFVQDWDINDTMFIIPDNLPSKDLTALGNMANLMGKGMRYNLGKIGAVSIGNLKDEHKDNNIIVYGTPNSNKLIKELNNSLWFKYDKDWSKFLSNEKLYLMDDYAKNIATFQLDYSSYSSGKFMLVLTSPNEELLTKSLVYLGKETEVYKLYGDGAVIDIDGNVRNFKYKESEEAPMYEQLKGLEGGEKTLLIISGLIFVFIIAAAVFYLNKNRDIIRSKKNK
ncbi:cellulose biosynthesis cyclic di-GMP-binding regulatory protein BcsB [Clostridium paraputrificum]|uniref:cellulose biosynthesis cyclic di-GMP-binding regulatory protein BcsB n=1 Tax=Clostridium paraputrificum TaxID=29363 RepID=UPI000667FA0F|nr:cellulose biosynthesis cyclic di-GMP-binding regulatory protein BcsB [Clostridium paraputrificum]MDB2107722.1 cellulose biosynthesis cyclic di-GMP-binding regulatory protein BcsB [Clostridium paraputrificum]MDB2114661.1 cellulose biosynthesis cyclic di-GMP-binding regulatory protein BcsB [Clostridium paraputrificum]